MLVLRGAGGHMQSPQSQQVGANPGATQDSGQLLVGLGEARVLTFQSWGGWLPWAAISCCLDRQRPMEAVGPLWMRGQSRLTRPWTHRTRLGSRLGLSCFLSPQPNLAAHSAGVGAVCDTQAPWS